MGNKIVDLKDAKFIIYDQLNIEKLFNSERFCGHSKDIIDMTINAAEKLAEQNMIPLEGYSLGSAAYLHALNFARERKQGLTLDQKKGEEVPIIEHPDVRKNLLWMKCFTEGTRALLLYTIYCIDLKSETVNENEKRNLNNTIKVLTPICRAYSSQKGFEVCVRSLQFHGEYGYCQEYNAEQVLREITTIFKETNSIPSNDLLEHEIGLNGGAAFRSVTNEMKATVKQASSIIDLLWYAEDVGKYVSMLEDVSDQLLCQKVAGQTFLAYSWASQYLDIFGDIVLGWMFLWQAMIAGDKLNGIFEKQGAADKITRDIIINKNPDATFLASKIVTAKFYIGCVLPEVIGKIEAIQKNDNSILKMDQSFYIENIILD
ncbi:MAG: acyl-CoA dehydrogenase C-terminal domain-containing protein [Syntrophomonadaceae bacterium]|nr:acyl-CoA dehydrogenase C-terminal domain-containing protein [Syntrophomonadaceae bacterium]